MSALAQLTNHEDVFLPHPHLLRAALEVSPDVLAIVQGGCLVYANPAFVHLLGFSGGSQLHGRALSEVLPAPASPAADPERPQIYIRRKQIESPGSELVYIEIATNNSRMTSSDLQVVSARDVTDQKQIAQKLRAAEKMEGLGRLVGGVAHDFNNLLTAIMLYCDLLVAGLGEHRRLLHHAEEIRLAGEHGAELIRQLMAMTRPQATEAREVSWTEVISGMRHLLSRLIGENFELITNLDDDLGSVRMEPAQMQQIVLNLVLNARDAMAHGGPVGLSARNCVASLPDKHHDIGRFTPCVELVVSDAGCGMDAETQAHLFEPFFTTKGPGRGTGLGLVTAASIVRQGGGTIQLASEVGKGTRVTVLLPRSGQALTSHSIQTLR